MLHTEQDDTYSVYKKKFDIDGLRTRLKLGIVYAMEQDLKKTDCLNICRKYRNQNDIYHSGTL